jgi:hypothetical protein
MEIWEIISNMVLLQIVKIWAVQCNSSQSIQMACTWIFQLLKINLDCSNMVIEVGPHDIMSFHHPLQDLVAKHGPCGF